MDKEKFIEWLKHKINKEGSQKAFANKHNISEAYLSDVLLGKREPGQKILDAVGCKREVTYTLIWRQGHYRMDR